jgi:hypothetical protein
MTAKLDAPPGEALYTALVVFGFCEGIGGGRRSGGLLVMVVAEGGCPVSGCERRRGVLVAVVLPLLIMAVLLIFLLLALMDLTELSGQESAEPAIPQQEPVEPDVRVVGADHGAAPPCARRQLSLPK